MYQRILVPLDGSAGAERAIPVAVRLAQASGGTVVLLRVAGLPTAFVPYPSADPWTIQKIIDADVAEARDYLACVLTMTRYPKVASDHRVDRSMKKKEGQAAFLTAG